MMMRQIVCSAKSRGRSSYRFKIVILFSKPQSLSLFRPQPVRRFRVLVTMAPLVLFSGALAPSEKVAHVSRIRSTVLVLCTPSERLYKDGTYKYLPRIHVCHLPLYQQLIHPRLKDRSLSAQSPKPRFEMASDDSLHGYKLYQYEPSLAAAVIFVIAFALTTSFHIFQLIKHKTWYMLAFLIGGFCKSTLTHNWKVVALTSFLE